MNKLWYLSQISILESLPEDELLRIDRSNAIEHFQAVPPNTVIQTPDQERKALFFVKEGKLKLYKTNEAGKQLTVGILTKGNMFGELENFSLGTKRVFIETMEESFICSMSEMQFEALLLRHPQLALKFLRAISDRLNESEQMIEQLTLKDLRGKIVYMLCMLADRFGVAEEEYVWIDLPLTHQEIANMIGATREAVSNVLRELAKEGMVRTGRMSIWLSADVLKK
ncbi:Crp/Fnr family transcriptional regulator [Cohnella cellulosilytica]|uniref:Crp/Fnr family transcriptional regulator n=1 Tax=Cohnella cellulosilytica TaxID=986710 RepID=A0ABW2FIM9_9BACL